MPIGTEVYDTAAMTGAAAPKSGTVAYWYAFAATPDALDEFECTTEAGSPLGGGAVTNGVFANSDTLTLTEAGIYEFWAIYSGDANNNGATSECFTETVNVTKNSPVVTTQVKDTKGTESTTDDTSVTDGASVPIGTEVYDTAAMTGAAAPKSGTVAYRYAFAATPDALDEFECTTEAGSPLGGGAVTNGVFANSDTLTLTEAGVYEFWAIYSGDANNNGATSECFTETVNVTKNSPVVTTQVKDTKGTESTTDDTSVTDGASVPIGTEVYDTAAMTGAAAPKSGTVAYRYAPLADGLTCSASQGTALGGGNVTNGVFPNSNRVSLTNAGTYEFWAIYSGDDNNNGATSTCFTETVVAITDIPKLDKTSVPVEGTAVGAGSTITYSITVKNEGALPLTNQTLVDTLPIGVALDVASVNPAGDTSVAGKITWKFDLGGFSQKVFTYKVTVLPTVGAGPLVNTVTWVEKQLTDKTEHPVNPPILGLVKTCGSRSRAPTVLPRSGDQVLGPGEQHRWLELHRSDASTHCLMASPLTLQASRRAVAPSAQTVGPSVGP